MSTKSMIWLGVFVGSTIGSFLGAILDHSNYFGFWGIALGTLGAFAGIWAGYKLGQ